MTTRRLSLEDLRLARHPQCVLALFRKLAHRTEPDMILLDTDDLGFPAGLGSIAAMIGQQ